MKATMQRFLFCGMLFCLLALVPRGVAAHANLVESDPAANAIIAVGPATARLRFSEPVETSYSRVTLVDAAGSPIETAASRADPADGFVLLLDLPSLTDGRYGLQWRALSNVDGHMTQGIIPFAIGDPRAADVPLMLPPAPPDPLAFPSGLDVALRALGLAALASAMGSLIFGWYVARHVAWPVPAADTAFRRAAWRLEIAGVVLALLVTMTSLLVAGDAAEMALPAFVTTARSGVILASRFGILLLLLLMLARATVRYQNVLGLALGAMALLSLSLLSHSAAPGGGQGVERWPGLTMLAIAFDWAHLVATAAWLGGLMPLLLALLVLRQQDPAGRARSTATMVARFTALATAAIVVLAATGSYAALQHLAQVSELWTTTYGRALSVKLVLLGGLLLLGGYNRWRVHPQVVGQSTRTSSRASVTTLLTHLAWSIRLELGAGVLLLVAVGILTASVPGRDAAATTSAVQRARVDDVRLTLQVIPAGINGDIYALDVAGLPPTVEPEVFLRASMATHDMGEQQLQLEEVEAGRWGVRGTLLNMSALWEIEAIIRAAGMNDVRHTFLVDTSTPAGQTSTQGAAPAAWMLFLVFALIAAALGQLPTRRRHRSQMQVASLLLIVGGVAAGVSGATGDRGVGTSRVPVTAASIALGRQVYVQHCASCHGLSGRGDGPAGVVLRPRPADFRVHLATDHTDSQLYSWVRKGVEGTAMPAFEHILSEDEIWHVINFIRTLVPPAR
jgi:copper transport protein